MQLDYVHAKIIHWDYEKSYLPIEKTDNYYETLLYINEDTKIKNGVLIKHVVRFHKGGKITLSCICEQSFMSHEFNHFDYDEVLKILTISHNDFNIEFQNAFFKETGLTGAEIIHSVKEQEVLDLLRKIQEDI